MSKPECVKLYRVGGANTILIEYEGNRKLLFDCGIDRYSPEDYKKQRDVISKLEPTALILSHDHKDHTMLLYDIFAPQKISNLEYIVTNNIPNYDNETNEYREHSIYDIHNQGKIYRLVRGEQNEEKIVSVRFSSKYRKHPFVLENYENTAIYTGKKLECPEEYKEMQNTLNNCAFLCVIENETKLVILSSDVSYDAWPEIIKDNIIKYVEKNHEVHIVIPHHGGYAKSDDYFDENIKSKVHDKGIKLYRCSNFDEFREGTSAKEHQDMLYDVFGDLNQIQSTESVTDSNEPFIKIDLTK